MSDDSPFDGVSSIIRLAGFNVPARARFVGEAMVTAIFSSVTLGLVCGQAGATFLGAPLVPFLVGSWAGYSFGLYSTWQSAKQRTLRIAERYPMVLSHAIWLDQTIDVPKHVQDGRSSFKDWILAGNLTRMTWCILAAQTCYTDIDEIERQKRQKLVDASVSGGEEDDEE